MIPIYPKKKHTNDQLKLIEALTGKKIKKSKKPKLPRTPTKIIPKFTHTFDNNNPVLKVLLEGYYLISSANTPEHYMTKAARAKKQRGIIAAILKTSHVQPTLPAKITLCRISPKELDRDDNLRHAFKNIKDGITDWIGLKNDNDKRLTWEYEQQSGAPKYYAIRITIEVLESGMLTM